MTLHDLLGGDVPPDVPNCDVVGIHNDNRQIRPGFVFFAYPGAKADGRAFIPQAIDAGAVAVLYETGSLPEIVHDTYSVPCIPIHGLVNRLAEFATRFYENPSQRLAVVGVTGTNGKTTVAYQLAQGYELLGKTAAYIGTIGQGRIDSLAPLLNTTPDALQLQQLFANYLKSGVTHVAMEVSSHALSLKRVAGVDFRHAVFTNLSHEHMDFHHSMAAYAEAKSELFAFPNLESAVINVDDPYGELMASRLPATAELVTYGISDSADVRVVQLQSKLVGSECEIASPWGRQTLTINTIGHFNVYNTLAVFASLLMQGFAVEDVLRIVPLLRGAPGRMEVVASEPCVLVDYAHTPDALANVLATLAKVKEKRLIVVFGCGGDRDKGKRPMMARIASEHADYLMITSDNPRTEDPEAIIDEICEGVAAGQPYTRIADRKDAILHALNEAEPNDIVLIAGKGHELYQEIGEERFPFSDKAIVKEAMSRSAGA